MTREEWKGRVVSLLCEIAPDVEPEKLSDATDLHVDLDLDSMDLLNLVAAIHDRLGVTIPDADASGLRTLGEIAAYLEEHSV